MAKLVLESIQSNVLLVLRAPSPQVSLLSDCLEKLVVAMLRGLQIADAQVNAAENKRQGP